MDADGDYVNKLYYNESSQVNTYYTFDEISSDWEKCIGDFPVNVYTKETVAADGIIDDVNGDALSMRRT